MANRPKVRWSAKDKAWRSDVGPVSPRTGRRQTVYWREIPDTDRGRRQAEAKLDDYLRKRDAEEALLTEGGATLTVGQLVLAYMAHLTARVVAGERSPETYRSNFERLQQLVTARTPSGSAVADMRAASFTDDDAHRLVEDLKARGCGAVRVKGVLRTCHATFEWAATPQRGREPRTLIPRNPFKGVKGDEVVRTEKTVIERPQFAAFLRACNRSLGLGYPLKAGKCGACRVAAREGGRTYGRWNQAEPCQRPHGIRAAHDRATAVLVLLQFYLGTRPSELCRAEWGDLDIRTDGGRAAKGWEPRAWQHPETGRWWGLLTLYGKTTRATGRLRKIPVRPGLVKWIERVRELGLHDRWIFPRMTRADGKGDGSWDTPALDAWVRKRRDAAGLPATFTLYAARHGMYTRAVSAAGLSGEQAGAVGGTSGDVVRRVYVQQDTRAIFESAERIERVSRRKAR